jgi:hypothetical protein
MKFVAFSLFLVLLNVCLWAQAAPPAQPQSPQPPDARSAPPTHHPMGHDIHQQHMQEMKAQLEKMHATLDQMKANLIKMKDPAAKQQAQLNVDLWQGMVGHLDGMVKMMSDGGMHEGGMMHGGAAMPMACCAGMKEGSQKAGCCGDNKCMQGMHHENEKGPAVPDEKLPQ